MNANRIKRQLGNEKNINDQYTPFKKCGSKQMILFDSHSHLNDRIYDQDLNDVLKRASDAGVAKMMVVGITLKSCLKGTELAEKYAELYASVGIHPHDTKDCSEKVIQTLKGLSQSSKVCAWGEIGLDFNRMFSSRADQEKWFCRQLEVSGELGLPVIFHERDSKGRFLDILRSEFAPGRQGVVHCFSGNRKELLAYLSMGLHIGITGILTIQKRGEYLRQLVPHIPRDRILVETDAPFLTPAPEKNRTRRNEPAFVKSVLLKLAKLRNEEPEVLASAVYENTCKLYQIPDA